MQKAKLKNNAPKIPLFIRPKQHLIPKWEELRALTRSGEGEQRCVAYIQNNGDKLNRPQVPSLESTCLPSPTFCSTRRFADLGTVSGIRFL